MTTVFTAFEQTARAHGGKPFLQVPSERLELGYARALERKHKELRLQDMGL